MNASGFRRKRTTQYAPVSVSSLFSVFYYLVCKQLIFFFICLFINLLISTCLFLYSFSFISCTYISHYTLDRMRVNSIRHYWYIFLEPHLFMQFEPSDYKGEKFSQRWYQFCEQTKFFVNNCVVLKKNDGRTTWIVQQNKKQSFFKNEEKN